MQIAESLFENMNVQLRNLRALAVLLFVLLLVYFLFINVATVASQRIDVRNNKHEIIGTALIPYNKASGFVFSAALLAVSGLQLWTIFAVIGMSVRESQDGKDAGQSGKKTDEVDSIMKGS